MQPMLQKTFYKNLMAACAFIIFVIISFAFYRFHRKQRDTFKSLAGMISFELLRNIQVEIYNNICQIRIYSSCLRISNKLLFMWVFTVVTNQFDLNTREVGKVPDAKS